MYQMMLKRSHPQALLSDTGRAILKCETYQKKVATVVIDEAHCMENIPLVLNLQICSRNVLTQYFLCLMQIQSLSTASWQNGSSSKTSPRQNQQFSGFY